MQYILLFLEGVITFISPCLLPMLPIYVSYFAGGAPGPKDATAVSGPGREGAIDGAAPRHNSGPPTDTAPFASRDSRPDSQPRQYGGALADTAWRRGAPNGTRPAQEIGRRGAAIKNALGFVAGFTLVFIVMGAFAGTVGRALQRHGAAVNIVTGLIVILFGLNFLGVLDIPFLNRWSGRGANVGNLGFFSSALFGMVFSIGWTPCVGAFLGSALMLASQRGSAAQGTLMLLAFSLGLGVPFLASAVLIDRLKGAFDFIKRNYRVINAVSGGFLVLMGILMMTGFMGKFLSLLSF